MTISLYFTTHAEDWREHLPPDPVEVAKRLEGFSVSANPVDCRPGYLNLRAVWPVGGTGRQVYIQSIPEALANAIVAESVRLAA